MTNKDREFVEACRAGDIKTVDFLLVNEKINVNSQLPEVRGLTPLMLAAANERIEVIQRLLSLKDIKVNVVSPDAKRTALMFACMGRKGESVRLLCADERVNVNMVDAMGMTALTTAAAVSEPSIMVYILKSKGYKGDPRAKKIIEGSTVILQNEEIAKLLKEEEK